MENARRNDTRGPMRLWHNHYDWVIAESPEAATAVMIDHQDGEPEDYPVADWSEWPPDRQLAITDEDTGERVKQTAAEWMKEHKGPMFLCSTEF